MEEIEISLNQEPDSGMKVWIQEVILQEKTQLQNKGAKVINLRVKNCSIVVDNSKPKMPTAVNRVEIDTAFDFGQLSQVYFSYLRSWLVILENALSSKITV